MLRKGQSVCWDDGYVYFVRGWTVFTDPADKLRCWYWKEASGEATWNFPADDAVIAFSKRTVPDGWEVYRDEKGTVWWWHEARNCYTYSHPATRSIRTFGVYESTYAAWDFNKLEEIQCDSHVVAMIDAVNKLLRMTALKEGLKHYLTADPTSVKAFSNRGTVKLPQSDREVDIGNWSYSVLFNIAMEIAIGCRYYCPLSKLFEQLTVQWPSLQRKWFPTKSSIVRKGDVIEVCLAFCKQPTTDKDIAEGRRNFRAQVATFHGSLCDTVRSICRCSDFPTSKFLPNPANFSRLLIFIWSGIHNHDKAYRDESFAKADCEKAILMKRIGSHNWFDD